MREAVRNKAVTEGEKTEERALPFNARLKFAEWGKKARENKQDWGSRG